MTIKKSDNYFFTDNLKFEVSKNGEKKQLFGAATIILKQGDSFSFNSKFKDYPEKSFMIKLEF